MPPRPSTIVTVASSSVAMQSQRMFPLGVRTSNARCPIAKAGVEPMPMTPGSYSRNVLVWPCRMAVNVVHVCPRGGMYCRSSSQITQRSGGCSLCACCVPQAVQM
jgi:hypothetical protein